MNVALLGTSPLAAELATCLQRADDQARVHSTDAPLDLLSRTDLDLVILSSHSPDALAVTERMADRASLIVIPDVRQTSAFAYSLVLQDQEAGTVLLPAFPNRFALAIQKLRDRIATGELGDVQVIRLERQLASTLETAGTFSLAEAQAAFLYDADLLRQLFGEFTRVSAVPAGTGENLSLLNVTLGRQMGNDASWSFRSGRESTALLHVQGERGTCQVTWLPDGEAELRWNDERQRLDLSDVAESVLGHVLKRPERNGPCPAVWADFMRAFDLSDALGRSIRRRRTIDLQFEETSERSQFKTHMTTFGCAIAGFTLVGLVTLLTIGAMFDPRDAQQRTAEAAGLVVHHSTPDAAPELSAEQQAEIERIRQNYRLSPSAILVETSNERAEDAEARRKNVVRELMKAGFGDADQRVVVRPFRGHWFRTAMIAAWVVLFLPLAVFLSLQLLLSIARPPEDRVS